MFLVIFICSFTFIFLFGFSSVSVPRLKFLKMHQKILSTAQSACYLFYLTVFNHITLSNNI